MSKIKPYKSTADIKVAVIGYGGAFNMGKGHLEQCKAAGMTPVAVCDRDAARLKIAETDFPGIETYTDLNDMLKKSDAQVVIHITPHNLHYPLALQCLKAGKHVVTEKPFVLTTKEADDLIKVADKKKLMVTTYHNRHWDGWIVRAVEQIIQKGEIGQVVRVEATMGGYSMPRDWWRTSKTISGGILYDWGVHLLEYSLQLIDSKITEVSGYKFEGHWPDLMPKKHPWKNDCVEDDAHAMVRFKNGAWINLSISHLRTVSEPYFLTVHGTKGVYRMGWGGWLVRRPGKEAGQWVETTGPHPKTEPGKLFYENVAGYLVGKEKLVITPEWARRPIHILDLAKQSAEKGKAMAATYA